MNKNKQEIVFLQKLWSAQKKRIASIRKTRKIQFHLNAMRRKSWFMIVMQIFNFNVINSRKNKLHSWSLTLNATKNDVFSSKKSIRHLVFGIQLKSPFRKGENAKKKTFGIALLYLHRMGCHSNVKCAINLFYFT